LAIDTRRGRKAFTLVWMRMKRVEKSAAAGMGQEFG